MDLSYENAIEIIERRQRRFRPSAAIQSAGASTAASSSSGTPGLRGTPSIEGMSQWLDMLGYSQRDLQALNIIHVAGTKGKGSTCAFVESIMRAHGQRTGAPKKTGLYTSPHLIKPEERIRINSAPLAPDLLAKYLFEIYDKLPQLAHEYDPSKALVDRGPRYLQLFALLAFHVFIREGVHVAIIETHSGGEYDATNVIQHPLVTAITTLGIDHIDMLGPTIENIAWHKSGVFKSGSATLSTRQEDGLEEMLHQRAEARGAQLTVIDEDSRLPAEGLAQLTPRVQRKNASLAIAVAEAWLKRALPSHALTDVDIRTGISHWSWPGRFQILPDPLNPQERTWYLDAAHNDLSVTLAAQWFAEATVLVTNATKVLIFTHINELRNAESLLRTLAQVLKDTGAVIDQVIFTTYHASQAAAEMEGASVPGSFHDVWSSFFPESRKHDKLSIEAAVECARALVPGTEQIQILVTGSQHLIGPALQILQADEGTEFPI